MKAWGGIEVKGKAEPVDAYRVLGRKTAPGRLRGLGGVSLQSKLERWYPALPPPLREQASLVLPVLFATSADSPLAGEEFKSTLFDYATALCRHLAGLTPTILVMSETLLLRGQSQAAQGEIDEAKISLWEALEKARTLGARWSEWQILATLSALHPNGEHSLAHRNQARTLIEKIADNLNDPQLKQSFLARQDIRQVLVAAV